MEAEQYFMMFTFPYSSTVNKYEKPTNKQQEKYGKVFEARKKIGTDETVLMKRINMSQKEAGFPKATLREIGILQKLKHDNITQLIEVHKMNNSFYMVYEFHEYDLGRLLGNQQVPISSAEIKNMLQATLNGLNYMHQNKIIHRDLRPQNISVTESGVLKISGFDYSRTFSDKSGRVNDRATILWYRAPEVILGDKNYGPAIDLWALGCIMGEMWARAALFQGNGEKHQLSLISRVCGSMTSHVWPGVEDLEFYHKVKSSMKRERQVKQGFGPFLQDPHATDLLDKLLVLDPLQRIDAAEALSHIYFKADPLPCGLGSMLSSYSQGIYGSLTWASIKRKGEMRLKLNNLCSSI